MIETVHLPELVAIGLVVEGRWDELSTSVPAGWRRLFELQTGATGFLEASLERRDGVYRELLGYLAARATECPEGLERHIIPAGAYLRLIHDGPLADIAKGYEALHVHAAAHGIRTTDFKLDFGYLPGLPPGRHELHVAIAPTAVLLG